MRYISIIAALCLNASLSLAADLATLGWGEFTQESDGPVEATVVAAEAGDKQLSLSLKLDSFTLATDAKKAEDAGLFSGNFMPEQPGSIALPQLTITVTGTIIKTAGTTASIELTAGAMRKTAQWTDAEEKAEPFAITFTGPVENGLLPVPFPVAASAAVKRLNDTAAAVLTIKSIEVTAGQPQVALGTK